MSDEISEKMSKRVRGFSKEEIRRALYEENTSSDNNDEDGESSYLTIFNHNFFKSRNRNHNFSKGRTGTVKK
jgi:hypothetical protein